MNCEHFKDLLVEFVYDELDDVQSAQLKEHASTCAECQQELEDFNAVRHVSASIPTPEIPTSFDNTIMEMARAKAALQDDRTEDAIATTGPMVTSAPSAFEKLAAFLFRPQVALPLVAAAVIVAVVTTNTDMSREMLSPTKVAQESAQTKAPQDMPYERDPASMLQQAGGDSSGQELREEPADKAAVTGSSKAGIAEGKMEKSVTMRRARNQNLADRLPAPVPTPKRVPTKKKAASKGKLDSLLGMSSKSKASGGGGFAADKKVSKQRKVAPVPQFSAGATADMDEAESGATEAALEEQVAPAAPAASMNAPVVAKEEAKASTRAQMGITAFNRGKYTSAVMYLQQALKFAPKEGYSRVELYHYLARAYQNMGNCSRAVKYYESILKKYPGYSKLSAVKSQAAACYDQLGSSDRALQLRK